MVLANGIIIKSNAGLYDIYLINEKRVIQTKSRGVLRHQNKQPIVGDHVLIEDWQQTEVITEIFPRRNELLRPLIANIDASLVVISVKEPEFQQFLLDKYLALLEFNQIVPYIVFTKFDLLNAKEKQELHIIVEYYQKIGYDCYIVENKGIRNKSELEKQLANKITTIMGQTGVGKTTLLNDLSDNQWNLQTNQISTALGRGKHTTRIVELFAINDYWIADTPGFSSFNLYEITAKELTNNFCEFAKFPCQFNNCVHINEKQCGVKTAVEDQKILLPRYEDYKKIYEELRVQEENKKW